MVEISKERGNILKTLFADSIDTITWSYLHGRHGTAIADSDTEPTVAAIRVGDFCSIAGDCSSAAAVRLVDALCDHNPVEELLVAPLSDDWGKLIQSGWGERCTAITRYAIRKDTVFDPDLLRGYVAALADGYELRRIDGELYTASFEQEFSKSLCFNFDTADYFAQYGLGFCAMHNGVMVAGASSYSSYNGGIEIEIDTRRDHRRRGLALACASRLILECLDCGLYPSWDAANLESVALAQKLGYVFSHEYAAYELRK